jgi:hypothetical protein
MRCVLIFLILLVLGQPTRAQPPTPKGPGELALAVQLDAIPQGATSRRPVAPGETLSVGDRIGLRVQVSLDAYVYVAQVTAGRPSILFSSEGGGSGTPGLVPAGVEVGLPLGGRLVELDQPGAADNLIVLASQRPLPKDAGALARMVSAAPAPTSGVGSLSASVGGRGDAPAPPPPTRPPPQPISTRDRDGDRRAAAPQVVWGRAAAGQVAVVRFPLRMEEKAGAPSK